ncbi:RanGTP-binding protein-domain-containing protein [Apodospora peruviana]|uniref:RanGTP-binding protein-domain-containing protein n=1 Tax=Apodospora peruviana TaxID=516989 RepID=A0AAE0I0I9_9PEZI|nr:RanGTP-binding protein-domain-containing protein [Apodospora peruviana]
MDALLERLGAQAINYAIRSGIALTSTYAVSQCSRLLKTVDDKAVHSEIKSLQKLLDSKIKILSPAIDLIEFKSGRGNVFLESAVPLAKSLHREIVRLGRRLEDAAVEEEGARLHGRKARMSEARHTELLLIISDMKSLSARIDRDIPMLQLAITASGENMSTTLTPGISPSRMMQIGPAFTLSLYMLFLGHSQTGIHSGKEDSHLTRLHPEDPLTEEPYGIGENERKPMWQEVMHKARVRLCRTPLGWTFDSTKGYSPKYPPDLPVNGNACTSSNVRLLDRSDEYSYHLEIIEDLDDGRLHEDDGAMPRSFVDMPMAGIRESIPIHQISKIFYTDTGRILNIRNAADGDNNPVLLLKRDTSSQPPIRLRQQWFKESIAPESESGNSSADSDDQAEVDRQLREESGSPGLLEEAQVVPPKVGNLPPHLDSEWLALEVYIEDENDSDSDTEEEEDPDVNNIDSSDDRRLLTECPTKGRHRSSVDSNLLAQIRSISLQSPSPPLGREVAQVSSSDVAKREGETDESLVAKSPFGNIVSSLSLLEMLIRLTSLQEFQQTSHLSVPDHILTFFLEETSTTGLQGEARWEARNQAKRRVGFDPYTDTPTKNTER